jgi:hypothetical protein
LDDPSCGVRTAGTGLPWLTNFSIFRIPSPPTLTCPEQAFTGGFELLVFFNQSSATLAICLLKYLFAELKMRSIAVFGFQKQQLFY